MRCVTHPMREFLMSKEKKEVHHISQVVDKLASMLAKNENSKQKQKQVPRRVADVSQQQGEYAAASVFYPEQLPGARIPDRVAIPTATTQTKTTIEAKSVLFTAGNALWMRFLPTTAQCVKVAATATGNNVATEITYPMNGDSPLSTMCDQIRLVSAAMRLTSTDSALNIEGIWYAINHKTESPSGTLVGLNPFDVVPAFRNRGTGKLTAVDPSMRFVWFPGDEEDQDFEPYPSQFAIDNTVTDVLVMYSTSNHSAKIDITMNLEYAPASATTQIVPTQSVVGDPSTYGQVLQQGMQTANMSSITSTSFNDDASKVKSGIKSITSVVGDIVSGNLLGAVKDGISGAGNIISGAKAGYNLISNAISSWFGLSVDADHTLRCLLTLSSFDKERKDKIRAEFEALVERKVAPVGLLDVFAHIEMSNFKPNFERQQNGRMHIVSITCEPSNQVDATPVAVTKPLVGRR